MINELAINDPEARWKWNCDRDFKIAKIVVGSFINLVNLIVLLMSGKQFG